MAQSIGSTAPVSPKSFAENNADALVRLDCLRIACRYLEARMNSGEKAKESMSPIATAEAFVHYVMNGAGVKLDSTKG